jgi:Tfp pilus assembly protein PilF
MVLIRKGEGSFFKTLQNKWVLIFFLFLPMLAVYFDSLYSPFVNLDDFHYIRNNSYIRDLSWKGIQQIFSQPIVFNYFPLQILSYAFDYKVWGLNSFGFHFHNFTLHFLNAVLVFLLLQKIFSNLWVSFFSALLFGIHPVNIESVTWVAERKNVLSQAFLLLSFLTYLHYLETDAKWRRLGFYLIALSLFSLALLAKVSAVVLPLLLFLYDFCFRQRGKWEMIRDKLPFFALSAAFSLIAILVYHRDETLIGFHGGAPHRTFLAMGNVFVEYIISLIFPAYLDHFYITRIPQTIFEPQALLSLTVILLLGWLAWLSFKRDRVFFFWLAWFVIGLLPVLNIVPIMILRADRYMYLPAIGFFFLAARGFWFLGRKKPASLFFPLSILGIILVLSVHGFLSVERNKVWKDDALLWEDNLGKFSTSHNAYNSLGYIYLERGKYDRAISYFRSGLQVYPQSVHFLVGIGWAYKHMGDLAKAEEYYRKAVLADPKDANASNHMGLIYLEKKQYEQAADWIQKALQIDPFHPQSRVNLGVVYIHQGRLDEAIGELEKAIQIMPSEYVSFLNLGTIYIEKGQLVKAEETFKKGLEYAPQCHLFYQSLGRVYFTQGKTELATRSLEQALRLNPTDRETNLYLGLITQQKANGYFARANKAGKQTSPGKIEAYLQPDPARRLIRP